MTNGRKISALASAALLLSALVACSEDTTASTPTDSSSTPSSSPSSPTTSEPPTDAAVAEEAASKIVSEYFATVDRLRQDAGAPLARLKAVTVGGELEAQTLFTRNQREQGYRQVGDTELIDIVAQSVTLDVGAGEAPTVQLDACWDVSAVDVLDRGGDSIVSTDRADRGWTRYTVVNRHHGTSSPEAWRVTSSQDLEKAPCSGE